MSTRSRPPAPLCLKKPNLLILPFVKGTNSPLSNASFTPTRTRESSPHTPQSTSTQKPTHTRYKSSQYARTGSLPRSQRKADDDFTVRAQEDGERRGAIKFGKAMQLTKITTQDKKEEMRERYLLARKYVQELKTIRVYEDAQGRVFNKKKMVDESERVIKLADNFFAAMNISVREYIETQLDSAMTIYPVEERQELATFYQMLTPEVCDFPFAFIAKLKIFMITICSEASLYSPIYNSILEQKKRSGLFVLKDLDTPEAVREYWYKLVCLHLVKADPAMFEEWKEFIKNENATLGLRKSEMKSDLEELMLTLQCVIRPQDIDKLELPRAPQKTKCLKKMLKNFEPLCFDEGWWDMKYKDDLYGK